MASSWHHARMRWPIVLFTIAVAPAILGSRPLRARQPDLRWEPLTSGVTARLRGVSAVNDRIAWTSGEGGTVLLTTDGGRSWQPRAIADAARLDLRDIEAFDARTAVAMSAGPGPASRIYRTVDGGATWQLAYTADHPAMFLDAIAFCTSRGLAVSDAVDGRFVILSTSDGGATWTPLPADRLPPALPGEGGFAASGTNVALHGAQIWIATTASRVLHSPDAGRTWSVTQTPVPTGDASGIFSIAFRDARHGVVVGGVYTRESEAVDNVATTEDGGATWLAVKGRGLSGYRSAAVHLPGLGPRAWLAVGPRGADWSGDDGRTWMPAGGEGYDALSLARDGSLLLASGAGGRLARVVVAR